MAVNINRPFMNKTGLNESNCFSNLIHHISPNIENEIDIINHSIYYNDDDLRDVLKNTKGELSILNLNTRFDLLKLFLLDVDINSQIDSITLQGTCFNENTDLTFYNIPGYSLISNPCRLSTHCDVTIYLHEKFSYEIKFIDIFSTILENLTIEICRNDSTPNKYLISTVYRPAKPLIEDLMPFIGDFYSFLRDVYGRYNKAYICGEMNINSLKINDNPSYNLFYENLTAHSFMPLITLPTRLSDTCDTLIDNIFTNNSDQHHSNCILTRVVSDHQMTCCMLSKNTIANTQICS